MPGTRKMIVFDPDHKGVPGTECHSARKVTKSTGSEVQNGLMGG